MNHYIATYNSPLGPIVIESDEQALTGLRFVGESEKVLIAKHNDAKIPILTEVIRWLDDYFAGRRPCNVPRLNPEETAFQRKVWKALLAIGYGQTKTYREIAEMVGCKSAQAVGQAIGRNPIALIIPCHRVVGANGKIGGYAYGTEKKKKLLEKEQQ